MDTRRAFLGKSLLAAWLGSSVLPARAVEHAPHENPTISDPVSLRAAWCDQLQRLGVPVLEALADGRLKATMPMEGAPPRAAFTHLEAFARLLAGAAPWLELGGDETPEGRLRAHFAQLARAAIRSASDPRSPDRLNFSDGLQPLVDTAFLAQALLRAPHELWGKLDSVTQDNLLDCLGASRAIVPGQNNWLLFAAMVESTLHRFGRDRDDRRLFGALENFQSWYAGDGWYGDGAEFHTDYYNAFVIHPMLVEILDIVGDEADRWSRWRETERVRFARFAAIQERLIAPDGTFPALGRSITYRCGAFHALALAALRRELPRAQLQPAQVRAALTAVIQRTLGAPGTFDSRGWLRIGLSGHQPSLGESYISTGSLYLCAVAFLPLGLPADDPFWSDPAAPSTWQAAWSGAALPPDRALKSLV